MLVNLKNKMKKKLNSGSTKKLYEFLSYLRMKYYSRLSDKDFLKKNIKQKTGLNVDLDNPKMLCEKILWIKYMYRNPLMTKCTDKFEVRNYVENKGYGDILGEIIGVYDNTDDIDIDSLPEKTFWKSTHASGINQIVIKGQTDYKKTAKLFEHGKKVNYYNRSREWNYKHVKPRILIEPLLDMTIYEDYKFFVIDGNVEYFAIAKGINDASGNQNINSKFNLYDINFNPMHTYVKRATFDDTNYVFSKRLNEMISIAEDLASPFPFCRVDFLTNENNIYFGEITFFPTGGNMVLYPLELEYFYGKKLDLSNINSKYLKEEVET
ncbi:ATP-grasp fold amidoligase family protein [Staphylococcus sp. EZ-P03]|uniref:ATP-grasp fold amidoligase family protein n=1 Tax=Staphylococcus sp. EZ-P03 TaxID=2282739 RepID=UPI000DF72F9D|nr:ATP-grasp fold amidoligase family protein [Staphylococcus sp. EZ-P03]